MTKFIGYIGTYTKGNSEGIYKFSLDTEAKKLSEVTTAAKLDNPTYLTVTEDNQYLYAVVKQGDNGGLASFQINQETGNLEALNAVVTPGSPPCHVSVSSDRRVVFSSNYHKGTVESYLTNVESGSLNPALSIMQLEGSGPHERQEKPHTHYAGPTPDKKYVIAVDLGIDQVITYKVEDGNLSEANRLTVNPGSGPRHIAFHPNGKTAYVMTEISSEVIVLNYQDGAFEPVQYISTIPEDFTANNQGSAIHISADGRYVYAGNRGHDSIAVFSVNEETGELSLVEITSTEGNWPRDFVLDPSETFVVASNEHSGNLVLYARDIETGKLTVLQSDVLVPEPVCVKFLNV